MTLSKEKQREYNKKHYQANKEKYYARSRALKLEMRRITLELKDMQPCLDCSVAYPYWVMQFDHRPDEIKLVNVSETGKISTVKALLEEIAKCDLVCANCHATRTHTRKLEL